jgi:hypothetical protein
MTGYVDPAKETFAAFRGNNREGPIHMLTLVRLNPRARYPMGATRQARKPMPPMAAKASPCSPGSAAGSSGKACSSRC